MLYVIFIVGELLMMCFDQIKDAIIIVNARKFLFGDDYE